MATLQHNTFKVKQFKRLLKVADWMAAIPNKVTPPPFRLIQIGSGFWWSRALYVAARLELADALGDGEKTTRQIANDLGLHEGHLYRLMRMLASIGIFKETAHRVFANSKMSEYLRDDNPNNVRAMILMHNSPVMTKPWVDALEDSIKTGETPFVTSHGVGLYDYMDEHKDFDLLFSRAMDSVEGLTGSAYLEDFDWSRFRRIIDVGGSKGSKSLAVLERHPHIKAVVFDRPQIIGAAAAYWEQRADASVAARVEYVGGDMFESLPPCESDDDLYMFMAIFHGINDEEGARVLRNLAKAVGNKKPAILIIDTVADATAIDPNVASFDMQMLIGTRGLERTLDEWTALLDRGGLVIEELVEVRTFVKFIVARPK